MDIKILRAKQYNSTYKHILLINGNAVVIAGKNTINKCIAYLSDESVELSDGKIKRELDKYRGVNNAKRI